MIRLQATIILSKVEVIRQRVFMYTTASDRTKIIQSSQYHSFLDHLMELSAIKVYKIHLTERIMIMTAGFDHPMISLYFQQWRPSDPSPVVTSINEPVKEVRPTVQNI